MAELKYIDLSQFDFIISTVHLDISHKDVILVSPFLSDKDIENIKAAGYRPSTISTPKTAKEFHHLYTVMSEKEIFLDRNFKDKETFFQKFGQELVEKKIVTDSFIDDLFHREKLGATDLPMGIAVPHGSPENILQSKIFLIKNQRKIKWNDYFVDIIFVICISPVDKFRTKGIGMFWLAFVSVGREGIETTLMLWGWILEPAALTGALVGILTAVVLGYLVYRGMLRIRFSTFFAWTGILLIIMTAGILAYGIHDLQEARFLPGPFSGAPITPTDFRTGEVLVGFFTERPYWGAPFPFGWAFDLQGIIDPSGALAAFLKGTVGFTPLMSWLEVIAWFIYLVVVLPMFIRHVRPRKETHEAPIPA